RKVLCILPGEAWMRGIAADPFVAMASGAGSRSGLARRLIAGRRGLRPGRLLQRIVKRNITYVRIRDCREHGLHGVVLALAALVGLHRRDEIFRVQSDEARHARCLADASVAVTSGTGSGCSLAGLCRVGF